MAARSPAAGACTSGEFVDTYAVLYAHDSSSGQAYEGVTVRDPLRDPLKVEASARRGPDPA